MSKTADNPEHSSSEEGFSSARGASRPPRLHHRARNHRSAHADPDSGDDMPGEHPPVNHPLVWQGRAELIDTADSLRRLVDQLRQAGSFAYDSEFIGEQSYIPQLCLIQVAIPSLVALIDPLADMDLTLFWELICDSSVEKVVHAGQQDVEPVFRLLGRSPANLFDTQIAAGLVHLPYPLSLTKLVQEFVGARLGKGLTFTSWDQRPLSAQQMRYAADDVRYLPAVRRELRLRLQEAGHAPWAEEESNELCRLGANRFDPDESYLKIRGASGLESRNLAVLRELMIWRDAGARAADVPPRTFLKDEILLALARSPIRDVEKLRNVRGLPRPVESAHGERIVAVTQKAMSLPAGQLPEPQFSEPTPREKFQCDSLWAAAQDWCFRQGVDPNLVSSRQEIGQLRRDLCGGGDPAKLRVMRGWRRAALGEKLLEMARKEKC